MSDEVQFSWFARFGMGTRGVLYVTIALIVLSLGRRTDPSGALALIAAGSMRWLLAAMAAGFVSYGVWRLADGVLDLERRSCHAQPWAERMGGIGSGLAHLFLGWQAFHFLLLGSRASAKAATSVHDAAEVTLDWTGGPLLLMAAGIAVAGVGAVQFKKAATAEFCDLLHQRVAQARAVRWAGRIGYGARGLVFVVSGLLIVGAGWHSRAAEAGGMDAALAWLVRPWDVAVAIGLLLFGLFCFVEARYRILRPIDADTIKDKIEDKIEEALPAT